MSLDVEDVIWRCMEEVTLSGDVPAGKKTTIRMEVPEDEVWFIAYDEREKLVGKLIVRAPLYFVESYIEETIENRSEETKSYKLTFYRATFEKTLGNCLKQLLGRRVRREVTSRKCTV